MVVFQKFQTVLATEQLCCAPLSIVAPWEKHSLVSILLRMMIPNLLYEYIWIYKMDVDGVNPATIMVFLGLSIHTIQSYITWWSHLTFTGATTCPGRPSWWTPEPRAAVTIGERQQSSCSHLGISSYFVARPVGYCVIWNGNQWSSIICH